MENSYLDGFNKPNQLYHNKRLLLRRVLLQMGWFWLFFFMIKLISFLLIRMMPCTIFAPCSNGSKFDPKLYAMFEEQWGLGKPLIEQFFLDLKNLFTGNWGVSITLDEWQPVWVLIWEKIPLSFEIIIITVLIALPISLIGGIIAGKSQNKRIDVIIGGFMSIFWCGGIFVVGIFLQYLFSVQLDWFPSQGYMMAYYSEIMDHYRVTGFGLIDSLLAGKFAIFLNIIRHLILPIATLFLPTVVMLTWIIRRVTIKVKTKTPLTFFRVYAYLAIFVSIEITFLIVIERVFNLNGLGRLYLDSIEIQDYFVIRALVIGISLALLVISSIWGIIGIFIDYYRESTSPSLENGQKFNNLRRSINIFIEFFRKLMCGPTKPILPIPENSLKPTLNSPVTLIKNCSGHQNSLKKENSFFSLRDVFKKWIFNPFVISSIILFLIFGILALIAPLLFDKAPLQDVHVGFDDFRPPMLEHPLGTTFYGQDVLGRVIWGIRIPMLFLILMSIVGVLGFCQGYFTNFKNKYLQGVGKVLYSGIFIVPFLILLVLILESIGNRDLFWVLGSILFLMYFLMVWTGFYIHNQFRNRETSPTTEYWQRFLKAIPLGLMTLGIFCLLGITLYFNLSYLGYGARNEIEWGWDVCRGHTKLLVAPWAAMWPGVAILVFQIPIILWIYGSWYAHVKLRRMKKVVLQEL